MKKLIITAIATSLPLLTAAAVRAETVKLVNADGSPLSQLCIAAARSEGSVFQLAKELGINTLELDNIACNGEPIMSFVRSQRKVMHDGVANAYTFNHGDDSMETELCIAAVTEPEKFEALKPEYYSKSGEEVLCNSQPLDLFVRRYGKREVSAL